jgi:hypothetical protein
MSSDRVESMLSHFKNPVTTTYLLMGFVGFFFYTWKVQPFAHIIDALAPLYFWMGGYYALVKIIPEVSPQIQTRPNSEGVESSTENLFLRIKRLSVSIIDFLKDGKICIPMRLLIPLLLFSLTSMSTFWINTVAPHLYYRNPEINLYSPKSDYDRQIIGNLLDRFPFASLKPPKKATTQKNKVIPVSTEVNSIHCTRYSEVFAKEFAQELIRRGINIQYVEPLKLGNKQKTALVEVARTVILTSEPDEPLTEGEIASAKCY